MNTLYKSIWFACIGMTSALLVCSCENKYEEIEKEIKTTTKSMVNNVPDTLRYPPANFTIYHESYYTQDEVIFEIQKPRDYMENGDKHPEYPRQAYHLCDFCYIQYRDASIYGDRNWYYYNPDTVKSTTPYKIQVTGDTHPASTRPALARLRADKLPRNAFEYRGIVFGGDPTIHNGKYILPESEWKIENFNCDPWKININGFVESTSSTIPPEPGENIPNGCVDVYVQFILNTVINLSGENGGGKYIIWDKYKQYVFSVSSGRHATYTVDLIIDEGYRRVGTNSFTEEKLRFNGTEYTFSYYVPNSYRGGTIIATGMATINTGPNSY